MVSSVYADNPYKRNYAQGGFEMTISERLFQIMEEQHISQVELSRRTGISTRTISDWRKKKTNPGADKILIICEVLNLDPRTLLAGEGRSEMPEKVSYTVQEGTDAMVMEEKILYDYRELSDAKKRRLLAYMNMLQNTKE